MLVFRLRTNTKENIFKYEWSVLELVDQIVRDVSGGLMIEAIKIGHFDPQYAKIRFGDVFNEFYVLQSPKQVRTHPLRFDPLAQI